jgi:hypothetical protein
VEKDFEDKTYYNLGDGDYIGDFEIGAVISRFILKL